MKDVCSFCRCHLDCCRCHLDCNREVYRQNINSNLILFSLFILLLFTSCKFTPYGLDETFYRDNPTSDRAKFQEISLPSPVSSEYNILVITDVHFGGENMGNAGERKDDDFFKSLKSLNKPLAFCVCLGDIAQYGKENEFLDYKAKMIDRIENDFGIKTYNVVGNHDLYNSGFDNYKKIVFPTTFYRMKTSGFSFYFTDTASGAMGNHQFSDLKSLMKSDKNSKIVFMHVPIYGNDRNQFKMQDTYERNMLISLFNKNSVKAVVAGHCHRKSENSLGNFPEYTIASFLSHRGYAILSVNETTQDVNCTWYKYD